VGETGDGHGERPTPLLQLRVLRLGFLQDGNVGVAKAKTAYQDFFTLWKDASTLRTELYNHNT
jgi:hypothetical protein